MKISPNKIIKNLFLISVFFINSLHADSFKYNQYNNHGEVGLINTPSARFFDEGVHGITLYNGSPDKKVTLSSNPYDWFEASFFYTTIQDRPYCGVVGVEFCQQDYIDKGFNVKIRLKKQGYLPSIAIGLRDFAGTGLYSSEYIVGSYGINKTDFNFGLGWGLLNGSDKNFKNPLGYINEQFYTRPGSTTGAGGSFDFKKYFSDETVSPFFGISHLINEKFLLKLEYDSTKTPGRVRYETPELDFSFGLDYMINDNFSIGLSAERGNYASLKFVYKNNPVQTYKSSEYKKSDTSGTDDKYVKLLKNLEENGIGVKRITETSRSIGLELTQFIHPNMRVVEEIIAQSSKDAGINKNIKTDIEIANLKAITELDDEFKSNARTIYERNTSSRINTNTGFRFRPFLASREEFFKGALMLENDTEIIIKDNLFFNTNLKYSVWDNFDDFIYLPDNNFPAQVRSDVKQYLKRMNDGDLMIGRAQLDLHLTPTTNHHLMFSGGILEEMFSGVGMEYLYFQPNTNYSFGIDIFNVRKRDYEWRFGYLDYENTTATANFYYRNYGTIPFDMRVSAGEYLAGDVGYTIEFSRSFRNGVQFGAFATFTDVTTEQFGEGSFDKGIFFNIPIYGNFINYTWRPLTKDPGAKLNRRHTLNDLLVKFRPIN
jgi:hypothetical protein